ncbi:Protein CBR-PQN-70 [Caenorhabditis briggsae]|uniref:Protein CBR-PQN-70 n=2 Tax=Caenorhabditis briggsae TaxID=6238 RepID=A8Y4L9_CAEBR|nr:Protein CBR-PQN-70 [Caenorhabditis briggsae]CAP39839.1 Protein CBR-PQN-70 [Caenorhabditis briggsae]
MGSSGMGIDANGKPIKRQAPANNKKPGNNQKKGGNNNNNNKNNNNRNQNGGNRNQNNRNQHQHPNMMGMVPPFGPMGPGGPGGPFMGPPNGNFNYFPGQQGPPQQNRRNGGGKNAYRLIVVILFSECRDFEKFLNLKKKKIVLGSKFCDAKNIFLNFNPFIDFSLEATLLKIYWETVVTVTGIINRYNGPSANNVGQGAIGANMNQSFGGPESSAMEVPGFGKNSNIHELFGKMIWRKMEQIQDAALVDQLQNRIMNLIHDALAGQNEKQQQQQGGFNQQQQQQRNMPFGGPVNPSGPFGNGSGYNRF